MNQKKTEFQSRLTSVSSTLSAAAVTKKLIEVALPLEAINIASAHEKSIRHGHPSTLYLWWARRPLTYLDLHGIKCRSDSQLFVGKLDKIHTYSGRCSS